MRRGKRYGTVTLIVIIMLIYFLFDYLIPTALKEITEVKSYNVEIHKKKRDRFERTKILPFSVSKFRKEKSTDIKYRSTLSACTTANSSWKLTPSYKTDPKKILIPALSNGPSNQLIGLYQSILLAIMLNRTIVIPSFYQHTLTGEKRIKTNAEDRFDVKVLNTLISTISMAEAKRICHNKFDTFFQATDLGEVSLLRPLVKTHLETGIRGLNYKEGVTIAMLKDFGLTGPFHKGARWKEKKTLQEILLSYKSSAPCAFYCCPFRQLKADPRTKLPVPWPRSEEDVLNDPWNNIKTKEDAGIMLKEIILHTPPILLVRCIQKEFIAEVLNRNNQSSYLAIHWRYDEKDYLKYLCGDHFHKKRKDSCDNVRKALNSTAFAQAIAGKVISLQRKEIPIASVYVAAPETLKEFLDEAKKKAESLLPTSVAKFFSVKDLKQHITRKTRYGARIQKDYEFLKNVISEVEMEICGQSDVFVWSKQSTWSQRAIVKRNIVFLKDNPEGEPVVKMILNSIDKMKSN